MIDMENVLAQDILRRIENIFIEIKEIRTQVANINEEIINIKNITTSHLSRPHILPEERSLLLDIKKNDGNGTSGKTRSCSL